MFSHKNTVLLFFLFIIPNLFSQNNFENFQFLTLKEGISKRAVSSISQDHYGFMWFGTDHIPTKYNWNILWANPLIPVWWWMHKKGKPFSNKIVYFVAACILISMINAIPGCQFLPQFFHPLVIMIGSILLIKGVRLRHN